MTGKKKYKGKVRVVGAFGIKDQDGIDRIIHWVVSPRRLHIRKHGYQGEKGTLSKWHKYQLQSMFRGWK